LIGHGILRLAGRTTPIERLSGSVLRKVEINNNSHQEHLIDDETDDNETDDVVNDDKDDVDSRGVVGKWPPPLQIDAFEWARDWVRVIAALHNAIDKVENHSLDGI